MIIFCSLIAVFFLQGIDRVYFADNLHKGGRIVPYLELSWAGIKHGYLWQFVTYEFLHAGVLHIIFNLFSLYFFGQAIEQIFGTRRFLQIYFGAGIGGGLLQILVTALLYPAGFAAHPLVGASAGIFGLITVAALTNPYQSITIWGVFPVRIIWYLAASGLVSLYFTILPDPDGGVAHAAHLGGILFGLAYVKWFLNNEWAFPRFEFRSADRERELVSTPGGSVFKKSKPKAMPPEEDIPSADFMSKEVDPILDKISAQGIQSLTDRERRILEAARAKMAKR